MPDQAIRAAGAISVIGPYGRRPFARRTRMRQRVSCRKALEGTAAQSARSAGYGLRPSPQ